MREDVLNWKHKSGGKFWEPFLDLFEKGPISDEEFEHIINNSSDNVAHHKWSHYNPVRKCLNAIYNQDEFIEQDLTEAGNDFLNEKVNFKIYLDRIEKYPMSAETFERLIDSPNTTSDYDSNKQNLIKNSRRIMEIANKLHRQNKHTSFEEISRSLESQVIQAKKDDPDTRKERLAQALKIPEQIQVTSFGFRRNADVIAEVLLRADGVCEECNKEAPFIRQKDNTPYLEVHHKTMLSDGGEDTVENAIAVCPNCHRELHFGV